jgi:hypothetical protein
LEEAGDELDKVLQRIHDDGLLSPLQVIQAVSNNAVITMGRLKKYLGDNIASEDKQIKTVRTEALPPVFPLPPSISLTNTFSNRTNA